jgi:cytochrome c-type biogenesis protein CcmH
MKRLVLTLLLLATPVAAVQPDEVLDDPALEARARALSKELRCVVCRSENIDDSNAAIARDLRLLVRERLLAGDTDAEVLDFLTARYGDYVLLNPRADGAGRVLWLAGPVLLLLGGLVAAAALHRRRAGPEQPLSAEEEARLADLTRD